MGQEVNLTDEKGRIKDVHYVLEQPDPQREQEK